MTFSLTLTIVVQVANLKVCTFLYFFQKFKTNGKYIFQLHETDTSLYLLTVEKMAVSLHELFSFNWRLTSFSHKNSKWHLCFSFLHFMLMLRALAFTATSLHYVPVVGLPLHVFFTVQYFTSHRRRFFLLPEKLIFLICAVFAKRSAITCISLIRFYCFSLKTSGTHF